MPDPNGILVPRPDGGGNVVFLLPAKTGNTALKVAILESLGHPLPAPDDTLTYGVHAEGVFETISAGRAHRQRVRGMVSDIVGVVRHPRQRFVSGFHYVAPPHLSFREWAIKMSARSDAHSDQHARSQAYDLMTPTGIVPPMYLLQSERLSRQWPRLAREQLGIAHPVPLRTLNAAQQVGRLPGARPLRPVEWNQETLQLVGQRYLADFLLYGLASWPVDDDDADRIPFVTTAGRT